MPAVYRRDFFYACRHRTVATVVQPPRPITAHLCVLSTGPGKNNGVVMQTTTLPTLHIITAHFLAAFAITHEAGATDFNEQRCLMRAVD
jgi:hypothetical protein